MAILASVTLPAIFHSGEIESSKNHNILWGAGNLTARYRLNENILIFQVFIGDKTVGVVGSWSAVLREVVLRRPSGEE